MLYEGFRVVLVFLAWGSRLRVRKELRLAVGFWDFAALVFEAGFGLGVLFRVSAQVLGQGFG